MASAREEASWEADSIRSGLKVPAENNKRGNKKSLNHGRMGVSLDRRRGKYTLTEEKIVPGEIQIVGRAIRHFHKSVPDDPTLLLRVHSPAKGQRLPPVDRRCGVVKLQSGFYDLLLSKHKQKKECRSSDSSIDSSDVNRHRGISRGL